MKNMSIGTKLIGGFVVVALITLVVGYIGWRGAGDIGGHTDDLGQNQLPSIKELLTMENEFQQVRNAVSNLLNPSLTMEQRKLAYDAVAKARENYAKAYKTYEALPMTEESTGLWKELLGRVADWKKENEVFFQASREMEQTGITNPVAVLAKIEQFRGDNYGLLLAVDDLMETGQIFEGRDDPTKCAMGKWMAAFKTENPRILQGLADVAPDHNTFHHNVAKIREEVKAGNLEGARAIYRQQMEPALQGVMKHMEVLVKEAAAATSLYEKMNQQAMGPCREKEMAAMAAMEKLVDSETHEAQQAVSLGDEAAASTKLITLSGMTAGFLAALGLGIALALSISRPLRRVIAGLTDSADQVAAASSQVSSSSQMLAEGASEQAAALEETSSSMEEMSSMTRQNAENAAQADSLMREANRVASHAQESMTHLTTSMGEINRASEETQKIIKTIDEIAFQTNLLALNAAVEAARAGEAGAGFAVVADEVRNLAMRAAEAAKNTATLIDGTVKRIGEGSKMVQKTNDEFNTVARSMTKAGELVGEISAASQEQAQGIDQVTRAISEMDKVVQQNASGAEESAAASEEMNAQAEHMKTFVGELENLVGGRKSQEVAGPAIQPEKRGWKGVPANSKPGVNKAASINYPRPKPNGNGKALPAIKSERRNSRAEQLIPMREEDFSDF